VITAAEVDASLAAEMRGLALSQADFLKTIKAKHNKNLVEFREDVIRPRLQMMRLVASRITVSPDDLRKAFESMYGEKVEGRLILWPARFGTVGDRQLRATRETMRLFLMKPLAIRKPRHSLPAPEKFVLFLRYSMEEKIEKEAFRLKPGQVSELIETPEGVVLFKCDKRIPADTTVNFEAAREKIAEELRRAETTG
jgi:hypothetical protein